MPDETELVAVVSHRQQVAEEVAERFGARRYYVDFGAALTDPEVQAVVICTPNRFHAEDSIRAANAGKHVLVEKIMANTVAEADAMIQAANRNGVVLMVAQCRRFREAVMTAKHSMAEIGIPINIIHFMGALFAHPPTEWWKDDDMGDLVLDMYGPHVVDTILWLMERKPIRVYAEAYQNNPNWSGCDEATVVLGFEAGAIATGHMSFNTQPGLNERFIIGSRGTMRIANDRDLWVNGDLRVTEEIPHYLQGGPDFSRQMREFVEAVANNREPIASGGEVREVVRVLEAARSSARRHEVITL
jgi:predicted dehydrogenase